MPQKGTSLTRWLTWMTQSANIWGKRRNCRTYPMLKETREGLRLLWKSLKQRNKCWWNICSFSKELDILSRKTIHDANQWAFLLCFFNISFFVKKTFSQENEIKIHGLHFIWPPHKFLPLEGLFLAHRVLQADVMIMEFAFNGLGKPGKGREFGKMKLIDTL